MSEPRRLSDDREHLNALQRVRRHYCRRIDYYAGPTALAAIETRRAREQPGSVRATNSAILDAIVCEWAALTGINNQPQSRPMTSRDPDGVFRPLRADAYDFGGESLICSHASLAEVNARPSQGRVMCGAKRRRDGEPCRARSEPGKARCKWHGGCSTGPRTDAGKARALANLRRGSSERAGAPT
jgi:hypothetical protein